MYANQRITAGETSAQPIPARENHAPKMLTFFHCPAASHSQNPRGPASVPRTRIFSLTQHSSQSVPSPHSTNTSVYTTIREANVSYRGNTLVAGLGGHKNTLESSARSSAFPIPRFSSRNIHFTRVFPTFREIFHLLKACPKPPQFRISNFELNRSLHKNTLAPTFLAFVSFCEIQFLPTIALSRYHWRIQEFFDERNFS